MALNNIPSLFAGMEFKEKPAYFESDYHANGERSKDHGTTTTYIYKNSGRVSENGRNTMAVIRESDTYSIYDLFVTYNRLTEKTWESLERYANAVGYKLPDDEEIEEDRRKRMEAEKQRQQIEADVNRYVGNLSKTNGTQEKANFWQFTARRGWNDEYLQRFRIGFDDTNKDYPVTIPVTINGRTAFFARRRVDNLQPKYKNDTGAKINGFGFADPHAKELFICEGIPDAMALNFFGFAGACAFSNNINNAQKEDIKRRIKRGLKAVFLLPDNDTAGKQATARNGEFLTSCGLDVRVITFTDVKDVDEYFFKGKKKKEDFEELKNNAPTFAVYMQRAKREEYQQTGDLNQYFEDVARIYIEAKPADKMALLSSMETNASADGYKYELFTEYTKKKEADGVANNAQTPTADDTIKQKASQLFKPYEAGDVFKMASHFEPEINTGYTLATMDDQKHAQKWTIPADDLTLICGYTSHGKSKVLQNLFLKLAYDPTEKGRFIFVSYEEGKGAILRQFVNIWLNNDLRDNEEETNVEAIGKYLLNTGAKSCNEHADEIKKTLADLDAMGTGGRIHVEETNASTTTEVLAEALRQQIERYKDSATPVRAVFIDYVQLLTLEDGAKLTPMIVLKDVALILHGLAKDTQTAIICGAQLQREKGEQNPIYINESNVADSSYLERTSAEVVVIYDGNKLQYREFAQIKQSADGKALLNEGQKALFTKGFAQPTDNAERLEAGGRMYVKICKHRGNVANVEGVLKYTPATGKIDNLPADVWASPSWKNYAEAMQIQMQAPATDEDKITFKPIANNKNELPF